MKPGEMSKFGRGLWVLASYQQFLSAPEPKAQVHYCDHELSIVRPSVRLSVRR